MTVADKNEALKELGRMAMERRESVGLSLEDIFEKTRVRMEFLRGIEQGTYQGFPDLVYIKGFVRTYLSAIGAEELKDDFMGWLNREITPQSERSDRNNDRRVPLDSTPANALGGPATGTTKGFKMASHFWLFVILFLLLAGSAGYVWYSWSNNVFIHHYNGLHMQGGGVTAGYYEEEPEDPSLSDYLFPITYVANTGNIEPVAEPEPVAPNLHIRANNTDVWVEVTISDRVVFSRTMTPGTESSWDLPSAATVRFGRLEAATVTLNGTVLTADTGGTATFEYNPDGTFRRIR